MTATKSPLAAPALIIAGALLVTAALGFVGCSSTGHDHSGHSANEIGKPYPRTICLVTDQAFKHGKPYTFVHEGQEIKLCCESCFADFRKNPAQYLARLSDGK